jgi:hypothetical protein
MIDPSRFLRDRGDAARDRRNWRSAIAYYKLYCCLVPGDQGIRVQLGHALKETGLHRAALGTYQSALRLSPGDADLHLQIGHLYKVSGHKRLAIAWYLKALEIAPDLSDAKRELTPYTGVLGLNLLHRGSVEDVEEGDPPFDRDRDRQRNLADAALEPAAVEQSERVLAAFEEKLAELNVAHSSPRIPRVFHFTHGFEGGGDIPYYGYLAIRAALHFHPDWAVYLYCPSLPVGPNWERLRSSARAIEVGSFDHFLKSRIFHGAHKADVIRLLALHRVGGIYLDLDTLLVRALDDLLDVDFCMGVQPAGWNTTAGLTDGVLIGRQGSAFSARWLEYYDSFRSLGRDKLWDHHSAKIPALLSQEAPDIIKVLSDRAFCYPLWYTTKAVLLSEDAHKFKDSLQDSYCLRLWNDFNATALQSVDEDFVRASRSIYADFARKIED